MAGQTRAGADLAVTPHDRSRRHRLRRRAGLLGPILLVTLSASCGSTPENQVTSREVTVARNVTTTAPASTTATLSPSAVTTGAGSTSAAQTAGPFRIVMSAAVTGTDDPTDVMAWETLVDVDPAREYAYYGQRGEAELGDVTCLELVFADGAELGRSYPIPGDPTFEPTDALGEFDDLMAGLPVELDVLVAITGAEAVADDQGFSWTTDLTEDTLDALTETLFNPNSFGADSVEQGTIVAHANADGALRSITIVAERSNGEQLILDARVLDLARVERVAASDTIESTGWCANSWPGTGGSPIASWVITEVADGDRIFDDEIDRTPVLIVDPEGTVTGSTGCSDIVGTATVDNAGVHDFDVRVDGPSCPSEHLGREQALITALNDGSAAIGHAGVVTHGVEGGAMVVLFAVTG